MIGKIKTLMMLAGVVLASFFLVNNASAITCPEGSIRAGESVTSATDCNVVEVKDKEDQLPARAGGIINALLALLGIVAVGVMIYGGAQMVLSQGDAGKVKTGRDAVIYGLVGLVVALMAWAITNFVIAAVSGGSGGDENNTKDSSLLMEDVVL